MTNFTHLIGKFLSIGMARIGSTIAIFLFFATIKRPIRLIECKTFCFIIIRIGYGRRITIHMDDTFCITSNFSFIKRPDPDGHHNIDFFGHVLGLIRGLEWRPNQGWLSLTWSRQGLFWVVLHGCHGDASTIYVVVEYLSRPLLPGKHFIYFGIYWMRRKGFCVIIDFFHSYYNITD